MKNSNAKQFKYLAYDPVALEQLKPLQSINKLQQLTTKRNPMIKPLRTLDEQEQGSLTSNVRSRTTMDQYAK